MTGRLGVMGSSAEHWYYPGRDHVCCSVEPDAHSGDQPSLAVPAQPPGLRERLTRSRELALERVCILAPGG